MPSGFVRRRPAARSPPKWRTRRGRAERLLTPSSFRNAQVVLQAIGGSTNGLIHLTAIANRTEHRIDLEAFDKLGREVPVLIDLKPSGEHYMEHFHHAGGVPKLMAQLGDLIDLDAKTISGARLRDVVVKAEEVPGQDVIRARKTRSSRKARWPCCMAISRRAARSSSIQPRAPNCCSATDTPPRASVRKLACDLHGRPRGSSSVAPTLSSRCGGNPERSIVSGLST